MAGSTTVTTVAALDTEEWTWQSVLVIVVGFCVALASTFTRYFKYRGRSYFLQQTADAIEEESNALALGVGEYSVVGVGEDDQALARFTERVEALRNKASAWYRDQVTDLAPSFMTDHDKDPGRQAERFTAIDDRLSWGGDVVGGWYLRGTGFASVHVVACSANRIRPTIPCPMS